MTRELKPGGNARSWRARTPSAPAAAPEGPAEATAELAAAAELEGDELAAAADDDEEKEVLPTAAVVVEDEDADDEDEEDEDEDEDTVPPVEAAIDAAVEAAFTLREGGTGVVERIIGDTVLAPLPLPPGAAGEEDIVDAAGVRW